MRKKPAIRIAACILIAAAPGRFARAETVLPDSPAKAIRLILTNPDSAQAAKLIDKFGNRIAGSSSEAQAALDILHGDDSTEAATLQAELLIWMARGDETPSWKRKMLKTKPEKIDTALIGEAAAHLLDHADPFVRGLAEGAIAIRLHAEYECAEERVNGRRVPKAWPDAETTEWYRSWKKIPNTELLALDYVRQAASLGAHRSADTLLDDATRLVDQAGGIQAHIREKGTSIEIEAAEKHHAEVLKAFGLLRAAIQSAPYDLTRHRRSYLVLRRSLRELVLGNPDIRSDQIVFALRQASPQNGNITVGRWNTHTPGGDILVKTGLNPEDPARPILDGCLGPGHVRGLELDWDARKLVFAFAPQPGRAADAAVENPPIKNEFGGYFGQGIGAVEEMSNLYEIGIDGDSPRQLTHDPRHADQEPAYLPNGDIVFVSDRSFFGSQCAGALEQDNMILNLHRCDPDGGNIYPLSNNKDFDRHPHVMDNGQLLFLHWEYQERHLWQTHSLWTCRPDGSMTDAFYKQHLPSGPMSLREARQVFGQRKLAAIACGHHNYDQGAVFLVDYSLGINDPQAMRNVTPGAAGTEGGYGGVRAVPEGGVKDGGGHYMFPYPLSDKAFLVSYSYKLPDNNAGQNFALYYIDVWGNKELIHRDRHLSVAFLSPVRAVPRPPVLTDLPPPGKGKSPHALAIVQNVNADWLDGQVDPVRYIRISQKVPWPCVEDPAKSCGFNDLHWMPAAWEPVLGMWDWGAARVIGIVPVEEDGSAYFKVPGDQPVYFQALDENFLEVRRMRSNVTFRAGESRSCVGCHESRAPVLPAPQGKLLALQRPPSMPEPPSWGDRILPDYEEHIQPIFDRHCVRCHGQTKPDGDLELGARRIDGYLQSYRSLFGLAAAEPTPFTKNYWSIWRPDEAPIGEATHQAAKTYLKNVLREPPADQLIVLADYTGGPEISQPMQFGSGVSRLTLTLLNNPLHTKEVNLSRNEWIDLTTWVDLNAQYWGTFVEKDGHFTSRKTGGRFVPPRRVKVVFPDPWERPPAGRWMWQEDGTVALQP